MALRIEEGIQVHAKKVVLYGQEGVGKSTLASQFPYPLFIDMEGSTKDLNVRRIQKPQTMDEFNEIIAAICADTSLCKTLVIDTGDWLVQMMIHDFLDRNNKKSIEDFGYGKGYPMTREEFERILSTLDHVINCGINVVINCHAQIVTETPPDQMGSYDHYTLKLDKDKKMSELLKEWAEIVVFLNFETNLVYRKKDDLKARGVGGQKRLMHCVRTAAWDAKNRYGLPETADLSYEVLRPIIEGQGVEPVRQTPMADMKWSEEIPDVCPTLMPELVQLMTLSGIDDQALVMFSQAKNWQEPQTEIKDYPKNYQEFLIQNWPAVKGEIEQYVVPF